MSKESISGREPKRHSKVARGAVVGVALGFLAVACTNQVISPEPDCTFPPRSTTGDMPSQNPLGTEWRLTSLESAAEQNNWQQFHSLNFPIQINYPNGWSARSERVDGKRQDSFGINNRNWSMNANISCEPVGDWVGDKDYVQNVLNNLKLDGHTEGFIDPNQIDIDGKNAYILLGKGKGKNHVGMYLPWVDVSHRLAVFIEGQRAWTFKLSVRNPGLSGGVDVGAQEFHGMLSSFRILK